MSTNIEWTATQNKDGSVTKGETWNPTAGCSKISPGCKNCYAIKDAVRLSGNDNPKIAGKYAGTVTSDEKGMNWTGIINLASDDTLLKPLRWTRPRKIFVNSMSDLFHENIPFEWIDKIFAVMALCPHHTFQILTKRANRMKEYFQSFYRPQAFFRGDHLANWLREKFSEKEIDVVINACISKGLPNVHLGVSVENQKTADERIPLLLETPAAVRWLSCEPLLGEVNLVDPIIAETWEDADQWHHGDWDYLGHAFIPQNKKINGFSFCVTCGNREPNPMHNNSQFKGEHTYIDWVVCGGESGNSARQTNIDWIRKIVQQCKSADVPVFVKQLGAWAFEDRHWNIPALPLQVTYQGKKQYPFLDLKDKKGGDIEEFPDDLKIRQMPEGK